MVDREPLKFGTPIGGSEESSSDSGQYDTQIDTSFRPPVGERSNPSQLQGSVREKVYGSFPDAEGQRYYSSEDARMSPQLSREAEPVKTYQMPAKTNEARAPVQFNKPSERLGLRFGEPFAPAKPAVGSEDTLEDVKRSALTRGAKGALGTMIGAPGSVAEFAAKDIPEFLRNRYYGMKERMDFISPEEKEKLQAAPLYSEQTEQQAKGHISPSIPPLAPLGLSEAPTYKGVVHAAEEAVPELKYESTTPAGKIAGEAAEMGAQGIAGGLRGMAGRVATGAIGGAGGEYMGLQAEKEGTDPLRARLFGTLGGAISTGALIHVGDAFLRPSAVSQQKLLESLYTDIRMGKSPMTLEEFNQALHNGTPVTVLDLAGPETRKLLGNYARFNGANMDKVADLNDFMKNRLVEGNQRVQGTINAAYRNVVGGDLDAAGMQEAVAKAGKIERDHIYGLLRGHPNAQEIKLTGMDPYIGDPILKEAENYAKDAARNPDWNIVVPKKTAAVPPSAGAILDESGQPIMKPGVAATETPGNLSYYNEVKKGLDGIIKKAEGPPVDQNTLSRARNIREKLVEELDAKVPDIKDVNGQIIRKGYGSTLDKASETFGAASAPEAGYKFFGTQNSFKRNELENTFRNYTPEQRELFSAGYAGRLNEIAGQANGVSALATKFLADRNFQERAIMALGPEKYNIIRGKILSENLLRKAQDIQFLSGAPAGVAQVAGGAGGAGATAMTALDFLMHNFSSDTTGRAAVAAVGAATIGAALNVAERRMAAQLIPLAAEKTPEAAAKFSKLLNESPEARRVFNKMNTALNTTQQQTVKGYLAQPNEPQERAFGGRTGFATGGATMGAEAHADRLVAAAERAHKENQKTTEPLLNAHDNVIAKALEVANQNI